MSVRSIEGQAHQISLVCRRGLSTSRTLLVVALSTALSLTWSIPRLQDPMSTYSISRHLPTSPGCFSTIPSAVLRSQHRGSPWSGPYEILFLHPARHYPTCGRDLAMRRTGSFPHRRADKLHHHNIARSGEVSGERGSINRTRAMQSLASGYQSSIHLRGRYLRSMAPGMFTTLCQ